MSNKNMSFNLSSGRHVTLLILSCITLVSWPHSCIIILPLQQGIEVKGKGVMMTFIYDGDLSSGPTPLPAPPPSVSSSPQQPSAWTDDPSVLPRPQRVSSGSQESPSLPQSSAATFDPGLIMMCRQAVAVRAIFNRWVDHLDTDKGEYRLPL